MAFDPNSNQVTTDPEYLLQNPQYIKQAHDLLVKYGIIPSSGFGADAATQQEVEANPYSIAALLKKTYAQGLGNNMNTANAHGALFSGAYQNSQLHSLDDYQRNLSGAGTDLQSGLNTISGNRTNTLVDIWQRLSQRNTAVQPDTQVYAPPTTTPPSQNIGAGTPVPQQPYVRTGPETPAQMTPQSQSVVNMLKKPKPVTGPQNVGLPGYR